MATGQKRACSSVAKNTSRFLPLRWTESFHDYLQARESWRQVSPRFWTRQQWWQFPWPLYPQPDKKGARNGIKTIWLRLYMVICTCMKHPLTFSRVWAAPPPCRIQKATTKEGQPHTHLSKCKKKSGFSHLNKVHRTINLIRTVDGNVHMVDVIQNSLQWKQLLLKNP